jgi:hypothetical protein
VLQFGFFLRFSISLLNSFTSCIDFLNSFMCLFLYSVNSLEVCLFLL